MNHHEESNNSYQQTHAPRGAVLLCVKVTMSNNVSQSAKNMALLFQEMRAKEARNHLQPHLKEFSKKSRGAGNPGDAHMRDLQQLACHWKLNKVPGFWTDNPTESDLLRSLYKHSKKLEAASRQSSAQHKEPRKVQSAGG